MLTVKDIYDQTDMLKEDGSGYYLIWGNEDEQYSLTQEDDCIEFVFSGNTVVEAMSNGSIVIDGTSFTAYVVQQIYFTPEQD